MPAEQPQQQMIMTQQIPMQQMSMNGQPGHAVALVQDISSVVSQQQNRPNE